MPDEVTIIGGGPCGSLLSILLTRRGYDVTVFELRDEASIKMEPVATEASLAGGVDKLKNASARSINLALSHRGIESLKAAGADACIMDVAIPMPSRYLHMKDGSTAVQKYGKDDSEAIYSVARPEVCAKLVKLALSRGVKYEFGMKFSKMDKDGNVTFESAKADPQTGERRKVVREGGCTFGCDGAFSATRNAVNRHARLDLHTYYVKEGYKELSMPALPSGQDVGYGKYAMEPNHLHIWPRSTFMLIALPNHDGSFTCTLFAPHAELEKLESWSPKKVQEFLTEEFPDAVKFMPNLMDEFFDHSSSPLVMVKVSPWNLNDNVLLLGDASHAVVPFYGQGMNAAFEDCLVFDELLDAPGATLRGAITAMTARRQPAADGLNVLAMMNYHDMAHNTSSQLYLLRKKLEAAISRLFPEGWIPLYTMVTFTRIPYNEVLERHERQERTLTRLTWGIAGLAAVGLGVAGRWLLNSRR